MSFEKGHKTIISNQKTDENVTSLQQEQPMDKAHLIEVD